MNTLQKKQKNWKLNNKNYYSNEANKQYLSVSQYKDFCGTLGSKGCEYQAMAKINGEYTEEPNTAMLIGSYVDSYFEGTLEDFKISNPEIFKKDGNLKSDFVKAEDIIARIKKDKKFMQYMSGDKQVIMTAELFDTQWKIKMDSYIKDKAIVDLKVVKDIYEAIYCGKEIGKLNFIQARGYDLQLAIYQKIVELNTGKRLPCYIAAADKGEATNIEIIQLKQTELDAALVGLQLGVNRIAKIKSGEIKPERCEHCNYCKETKIITKPISMADLIRE